MRKFWLITAVLLTLTVAFCAVALAGETHMSANETKVLTLADNDENYHHDVYYAVSGSGPQLVSVEITSDIPLRGNDDASELEFPYRSAVSTGSRTIKYANVLGEGEYRLWFNLDWGRKDRTHSVTVKITSTPAEDNGEQDADYDQQPELGATPVKGALWRRDHGDGNWEMNDRDCFKLVLTKDSNVKLTLKSLDRQVGLRIERFGFDEEGHLRWIEGVPDGEQWYGTREPLATPVSRTFNYDLRAGEYCVTIFNDWDNARTTRYELSAAVSDLGVGEMFVPKTYTVSAGLRFFPLSYTLGDEFWPGHSASTSNAKVVALDEDSIPSAVKPGKATLTFISGGKTYKCKVTVVKNEFVRKKPLKFMWNGIYTSAKKISYGANNALNIEIFVYNNTGKTITTIGDPVVQLIAPKWDSGVRFAKNIPAVTFAKPIKQGKYGVIKVTIPYSEYANHFGDIMDLRNGELEANIALNASAKAALKGAQLYPVSAKTAGAMEALDATE